MATLDHSIPQSADGLTTRHLADLYREREALEQVYDSCIPGPSIYSIPSDSGRRRLFNQAGRQLRHLNALIRRLEGVS